MGGGVCLSKDFHHQKQLEAVYIEIEFKYTNEEGMGNGKTHQWQITTFSHPSLTGE
jgi:hypothetical protein